jgi:uncharacterized protein YdcH (DUF465 family)
MWSARHRALPRIPDKFVDKFADNFPLPKHEATAMNVDHHDLHHEFPEFATSIHALKVGDKHFAKLFDEYHALTSSVEAIEVKDSPVADATLETMKLRRVRLKDELYTMLKAHKV